MSFAFCTFWLNVIARFSDFQWNFKLCALKISVYDSIRWNKKRNLVELSCHVSVLNKSLRFSTNPCRPTTTRAGTKIDLSKKWPINYSKSACCTLLLPFRNVSPTIFFIFLYSQCIYVGINFVLFCLRENMPIVTIMKIWIAVFSENKFYSISSVTHGIAELSKTGSRLECLGFDSFGIRAVSIGNKLPFL